MDQDRRTFIASLGAAALGLAVTGRPAAGLAGRTSSSTKLARIGIQLYTLRQQASADLAGTLEQLARIGYKDVELAGYYKHSATEVRALLDRNGLKAPSGHLAFNLIETNPAKTFDEARTVGHEWITIPSLPRGARTTADDWKRVAERFNNAATQAKAAGFRFAFHNHNDIVKRVGDILPIEILMKETDPTLVSYQMDIYWVVHAGADPLALLARYPGRFKMLHVKDSAGPPGNKMVDVGAGTIDFKKIFAAARGIEHYFVEHDEPANAIASARASYEYLVNMEY